MHIFVVAFNGLFDAGLSLVLDTFYTANALAREPEQRLAVSLIGLRPRVRTHLGFEVPTVSMPPARPDVVLVPALACCTPRELDDVLAGPELAEGRRFLRDHAESGVTIAAACTATFVLGDAGLLDGKRATTTWWLAQHFRKRFPVVLLETSKMLIESPGTITAGSALAHLDLALHFVRHLSPGTAQAVAAHLLYDSRPSQAPYIIPDLLAHADSLVTEFESWARSHLKTFSMAAAAHAIGTSERTLERRVKAALGKSPLAFVQDLRIAYAKHRLATTSATLDDIAEELGYASAVSLGKLLRSKTGRGVRAIKRDATE